MLEYYVLSNDIIWTTKEKILFQLYYQKDVKTSNNIY